MTDETIKGDCSVSLIRDNEDGSADYQFNFPPEALEALLRLGILTAIKAGIAEAECLNPDTPTPKQWVGLTDEEINIIVDTYHDSGGMGADGLCDGETVAYAVEALLKEKNYD
tara:strand:+ start:85 stop:423 length:339 start_codon:yes stop_codon:yes gene_type:complete